MNSFLLSASVVAVRAYSLNKYILMIARVLRDLKHNIRYFHRSQDTPCLPPKMFAKALFSISLGIYNDLQSSQEKLKTMLMQTFWEVNKVYYGIVKKRIDWGLAHLREVVSLVFIRDLRILKK